MAKLSGKNAVVTGGSTGIGYETARQFLAEGAQVLITGQNSERLEAAQNSLGGKIFTAQVDHRIFAQNQSLGQKVNGLLGSLDILVLNAGVTTPAPTENADEKHFDDQIAVNLKGPYFTVQSLLPLLGRGASIVANTSCLDVLGMPGMGVYSAAKAALRSLVRTWAAEFLAQGIRVNAVAPGPIETPIYGKLGLAPEDLRQMAESIQSKVPMNRFGKTSEVAAAILFLASSDSSFMTGAELPIDGGWTTL